jgi:ABC-2 type transport system permease protein
MAIGAGSSVVSNVPKRRVGQAMSESYSYRELLVNLTQRELRSRYRRSFLGWGWSLLQPALMTLVYAIVLGQFFKIDPPTGDPSGIDNYALFLLAGVLPWTFFATSLTGSMGAVANAGSLVTRVWFPREIIPLATIGAAGISLLIEFGVLAAAILIVTGHLMLHLVPVLLCVIALQAMFSAGLAFWLSACNVRFRDVEYLTSVVLLAYFYLTPILYPPELIPDTELLGTDITARQLALANPMARFAMAYRNIFYDIRLPGLNTALWLVGWSLVLFFLGFRFYVRRSDYFAESM